MSQQFNGKVAMITGAADGIGRASALAFAARGACVVLCGHSATVSESVALVEACGARALALRVDVANSESVRSAIDVIIKEFGRLDYAHNNAGTFRIGSITDLSEDDWNQVLAVNLTGVYLCMKYQMPHLIKSGGAIVNTASVFSFQAGAMNAAYVASKHGLIGLTRAAALDYGHQGVRINAVAPGPINTPMTAPAPPGMLAPLIARTTLGRIGQPDEVGEAVAWLCSDAAAYINGVVLPVDGGYLAT